MDLNYGHKGYCWMNSLGNETNKGNASQLTIYIKENIPQTCYQIYDLQKKSKHKMQSCYRNKKIKLFNLSNKHKISLRKDAWIISKNIYPKINRIYSMPILNTIEKHSIRSGIRVIDKIYSNMYCPFKTNVTENKMNRTEYLYRNNLQFKQNWKIYRCQFNTQEESCCCSCNSDAMFEVMKSLYDCYKKKNCDHCNCILCGHLPREERRLGEIRKSEMKLKEVSVAEKMKKKAKSIKIKDITSLLKRKSVVEKEKPQELLLKKGIPSEKLRKAKAEGLLTPLAGKTPEQKEKILRGLVMNGIPLPASKTASDKKITDKVRKDLGLPPEPRTSAEKKKYNKAIESGLITPLEGKSPTEKEKVLKGLADLGVSLPEGRTPSEQSIINKLRAIARIPPAEEAIIGVSKKKIQSEKLRKAKTEGLLTPLAGKTPEQKEKILRGLVMNGIPLPASKTASDKKITDKVRKDLGLPPEPLTSAEKKKYNKAIESGLITPLEGKSPLEKEKVLKGLADLGVSLPEGRTPSERSIINKVRATARIPSAEEAITGVSKKKIPSEKLRKAKAEGLLTPLAGKTPEQKEQILRGLVERDIGTPALPLEKRKILDEKTLKLMKEGKGPSDECICGLLTPESERTSKFPSRKPSAKLKLAKTTALLTPLERKTASEKEIILKDLVKKGIPLPEPKTMSEKKILHKVQHDLGLPPIPQTPSLKEKYAKALAAGIITPLEGKTQTQKEKILTKQAEMGIPLPVGRSPSEKALIDKIRAREKPEEITPEKKVSLPSPFEGKTLDEKEIFLKNLAKAGLPLPEGKTPSEKQVIKKIKEEMGIAAKVSELSEKLRKTKAAGLLTPLEGKTPTQKKETFKRYMDAGLPLPEAKTFSEKKILKDLIAKSSRPLRGSPSQKEKILKSIAKQGLPLPEPKTLSDKEIVEKVRAEMTMPREIKTMSKKLKQAKAAGLLTPLEGKKSEEKEKILIGLAKAGIPLPEAKTASEQKISDKVRQDLGLPPEPKTPSLKEKMKQAQAAGIITPLEGKTQSQKEKALKKMYEAGIPLPKGRTSSEKSMIKKIKGEASPLPSKRKEPKEKESLKEAKAKGLLTPLEGKSFAHKEKILRGLAKSGLPLPEGKTPTEKALISKILAEEGVSPPRAALPSKKLVKLDKKTAKIIKEGKGPSDECICDLLTPEKEKIRFLALKKPSRKVPSDKLAKLEQKMPLPEPKTESERKLKETAPLIKKPKSSEVLAMLEGKPPQQKEKILKDMALKGIPLPEGKTASEKIIINKVRDIVGLPPLPKSSSEKIKYKKALAAGLITPLLGKSVPQKEKILRGQAEMGLNLPQGRTQSEKALIQKIKETAPSLKRVPSEKLKKPKASEILAMLKGKRPEQKEKILNDMALKGIPLPEGKTTSEKVIINKVRDDIGLPPLPKTSSEKIKYKKALTAGLITPLLGKSVPQKEKILRGQAEMGLNLPQGKTQSEKALIQKIKETAPSLKRVPSEKLKKPKASEILTMLKGKRPEQKEKILKDMALKGIPLPEGKTASEKIIINKVRDDVGLPPLPKTSSAKIKYKKALAAGLITPLLGKSVPQKEKILRGQAEIGLNLPQGRTQSEKALIQKIKETAPLIKKPKSSEVLAMLEGKPSQQKEKILKDMALKGIPLPEGKTASEKIIINKVRDDVGLPPLPKSSSEKIKYKKALAAGLITPLLGKSVAQKEKILRGQAEMGLNLPQGRTQSEKALIQKIKETAPLIKKPKSSEVLAMLEGKTPQQKEKILKDMALKGIPLPEGKTASEKIIINKVRDDVGLPPLPKTSSEKIKYKKALAAGLITPLLGKSGPQKEKILRGQAEMGLNLPQGTTSSEKALIQKIKETAPSLKRVPSEKLKKPKASEILAMLKGKRPEQKEKILKDMALKGIPLPEGKTASEKKVINKVKADIGVVLPEKMSKLDKKTAKMMKEGKGPSDECICDILTPELEKKALVPTRKVPTKRYPEIYKVPSKKIRKAKADGLLTPLHGKSLEQKEKILKGLAMNGIPLPEAKTASERKLIDKIRNEIGLPPEPKTPSMKEKYNKAIADDIITPLEGKTNAEKERILQRQAELGLPFPIGRTASEKALIAKIKETVPSEKIRKAKTSGLLTPLKGKTPEKKEKILKKLVEAGLPLPEGKTPSEKALIQKVLAKAGEVPEKKAKIKTKSKKLGVAEARRSVRGVGVSKSKGGIIEEFQDIIKTTTCDRGCGCDKKKIRFKHSYVKIRVTSPDISSLCPCPEECVPGVKGGIFTDNQGIKVTVGRVTGIASFSSWKSIQYGNNADIIKNYLKHSDTLISRNIFKKRSDISYFVTSRNNSKESNRSKSENEIYTYMQYTKCQSFQTSKCKYFSYDYIPNHRSSIYNYEEIIDSSSANHDFSNSLEHNNTIDLINSDSIYLLETISSLSLPDTVSVWSISITSSCSSSSFYKEKYNFSEYNLKKSKTLEYIFLQNAYVSDSDVSLGVYNYSSGTSVDFCHEAIYMKNNLNYKVQVYIANEIKSIDLKEKVKQEKHIAIFKEVNSEDKIHTLFYTKLSQTQMYNSFSFIIIMSTSSEDCSSIQPLTDNCSSTICLELSENQSNWNFGSSTLHHVQQMQKGFKISTDSNLRKRTDGNKSRMISTDTTEDRPCCCLNGGAESRNFHDIIGEQRVDNIASEFVTPIIIKEVVAQGLCHESSYISKRPTDTKIHSSISLSQSYLCKPTPIRLCKEISPCERHTGYNHRNQPNNNAYIRHNDVLQHNSIKACDCSAEKLRKMIQKTSKQFISKACGVSTEELCEKPINLNQKPFEEPCDIPYRSTKMSCDTCGSFKSNLTSGLNNDKSSKLCPCEQHDKDLSLHTTPIVEKSCQCSDQKHLKKNKNIICECPEEPEPEIIEPEIDEKQMRKIMSDLTQTTSGFKIDVLRKISQSELSFAEALRYYAENLEEVQNATCCACEDKKTKKKATAECECPYEALPPQPEPFMGIKFHIDGKGTGSKGLSGILCFE